MKKTIIIIMAVSLLLILGGCNFDYEDTAQTMLSISSEFSRQNIPLALVKQLTKNQINIVGETHEFLDNDSFYISLIPLMHNQGIRMIAIEKPLALTFSLDQYVLGNLKSFPWKGDDYSVEDIAILEPLKEFNRNLRNNGKDEEQIRLVTFDIDLRDGHSYYYMIFSMKRLGLHFDFSNHLSLNQKLLDKGVRPGMSEQLDKDFLWYLEKEKLNSDTHKVYNPIIDGIEAGKKFNQWAETRESFITDNIVYFSSQLKKGEKMMIITGQGHSQKENGMVNDDFFPKNTMAKRLNTKFPEGINSATILFYQYKEVNSHNRIEEKSIEIIVGTHEFIEELKKKHGNMPVWLPINTMPKKKYTITLKENGFVAYKGNIQNSFDTLIFFPTGTKNMNK